MGAVIQGPGFLGPTRIKRNKTPPSVGHWPSSVSYKGYRLPSVCPPIKWQDELVPRMLQLFSPGHKCMWQKWPGGGRHGGELKAAGLIPSNRELQTQGEVTALGLPKGYRIG